MKLFAVEGIPIFLSFFSQARDQLGPFITGCTAMDPAISFKGNPMGTPHYVGVGTPLASKEHGKEQIVSRKSICINTEVCVCISGLTGPKKANFEDSTYLFIEDQLLTASSPW